MKKNLKFCLVFNADTSGEKKIQLINNVIELLKIDHHVELFKTTSEEFAEEVFKDLSVKSFDRLVLVGGDGSVCFGINQILKYPSLTEKIIGYIPTGTTNILQFEARIQKNAKAIAQTLIVGNAKKINLVKINNYYFFLMAGIGFDGRIVASIDIKIKKYIGKTIFALKGFQHFLFLNNQTMEVVIDKKIIQADWILCTNSKYYAGTYRVTKDTDIFKNSLVTYVFKNLTRLNLLYYMCVILFKGDLSKAKGVLTFMSKNIKINRLNADLVAQIDGGSFNEKETIEIKQTDRFINLLVP